MTICEKHNEPKVQYGNRLKCKSCNREYQRKWFKENISIQRKRVKRNTLRLLTRNSLWRKNYLLQNPCVDCGETDPDVLEFDHIDPSTKEFGLSEMRACSSIERLEDEAAKCEIRCANCHRRRTIKQRNFLRV